MKREVGKRIVRIKNNTLPLIFFISLPFYHLEFVGYTKAFPTTEELLTWRKIDLPTTSSITLALHG
jgi:hypothetical protein